MGDLQKAKGYIEKYGGKPGLVLAVKELGLDVPVLDGIVVEYGTGIKKIEKLIKEAGLQPYLICRQAHKRDVDGHIDVWRTLDTNLGSLKEAIREEDEHFKRIAKPDSIENKVLRGLGDYPISLDEPPYYFIQNYKSGVTGSLLRNPTNKDMVLISYKGYSQDGLLSGFSMWKGNEFIHYGIVNQKLEKKLIDLISNYKKLENSGLLDPGWSYQMELLVSYNFSDAVALQIRKFRPFVKETKMGTNRSGKLIYSSNINEIEYGLVLHFGITPLEGIEFTYIKGSLRNDLDVKKIVDWSKKVKNLFVYSEEDKTDDYKYNMIGENLKSIRVMMRKGNQDFLAHDSYRLFKFIPFSLIVPGGIEKLSELPNGTKLRYYADRRNIELRAT